MPTIQIEVRQQYPQAVEEQLLNSVFHCVKTAFQLPEYDRNIRLVVHEAHRFHYMSHLAQPEYFTLISIDCFAGRSLETKRNLYQQMVKSLGEIGIPADYILIHLRESALENWEIRGGQAACDVDLGFKVDV
jgi:5-carboxymethyl-2-hydroxymuconate isomerase